MSTWLTYSGRKTKRDASCYSRPRKWAYECGLSKPYHRPSRTSSERLESERPSLAHDESGGERPSLILLFLMLLYCCTLFLDSWCCNQVKNVTVTRWRLLLSAFFLPAATRSNRHVSVAECWYPDWSFPIPLDIVRRSKSCTTSRWCSTWRPSYARGLPRTRPGEVWSCVVTRTFLPRSYERMVQHHLLGRIDNSTVPTLLL